MAVLTTREPGKLEHDRLIFGIFLVDETYEGDYYNEGYVSTQSKYKISLSINEARKIKFWNYYANVNSPEKISWGQGLYRYLSDIQAASILNDIYEIKKGTKDEVLSKEFLNEFCRINNISDSFISPFIFFSEYFIFKKIFDFYVLFVYIFANTFHGKVKSGKCLRVHLRHHSPFAPVCRFLYRSVEA